MTIFKKTLCPLTRLGVLRFTGRDVRAFLQGQITLDVDRIDDQLRLAGYCDPAGKLLATWLLFEHSGAIFALTAKDNLDFLSRRLRLYTLRREVSVESEEKWLIYGTTECEENPSDLFFTLPFGGLLLSQTSLETPMAEDSWWEASAKALFPWVFSSTKARFIAQSLNLDLLDAVTWNKGCYVGQEIISRIHSIGKPSRRMALYERSPSGFQVGGDLKNSKQDVAASLVYASGRACLAEVSVKETPNVLFSDAGETLSLVKTVNDNK